MDHSPGFLALAQQAKNKVTETTVDEVFRKQQRNEKFHLIDVREDDEWRQGRVKGAVHLGKGVIERDIEALIPEKNAAIVLYCGGGFRSALAAEAIQRMGYTNVLSMQGGIKAWQAAGLPQEK